MEDCRSSDPVAHDELPSPLSLSSSLTADDKISTTSGGVQPENNKNQEEEDPPTSLVDNDREEEEEEDYSSINMDSIIDTSIIGVDFTPTSATSAGETTTEPNSMDLHNHSDLLDRSGIDHPDDDDDDTATATAPQQHPPKMIAGADVPVPGLESSIVSGTTDLFEGDLCDDELSEIPSIMMPNGNNTYDENLQLNPVDLVDEVQAEVEQEAARDPQGSVVVDATFTAAASTIPAADTHVTDNTSTNTTTTTVTDAHPLPQSGPRRPVVPFVVRKLSDAETAAGKKRAATPLSTSTARPETKKARQNASGKSSTTEKTTTTTAATTTTTTGRITRSRAKNVESASTLAPQRAPPPISDEGKAKGQQEKLDVAVDPPKPQANKIVLPNDLTLKTETVVSASASVASAPDEHASLSVQGARCPSSTVSVVTPMESDDTINAKQLAMKSKMECASISIPTLRKDSTSGASCGSSINETDPRKVVATTAAAPTAALNDKPPSSSTPKKSNSRRSSASKTAAGSKATSTDGGTTGSGKQSPSLPAVPVDTSTAHIQALTGENGASVCLSIQNCTFLAENKEEKDEESSPPTIGKTTSREDTASSQASSQPLTEAERAQQSRDRNRRHARNTRLRKKAYVEELKQTLVELANQRDQALEEQELNQQRESEQREVRFQVMEEFLKLRGRNEKDANLWSAILAPSFSLSLPLTPFQDQVVASTVANSNNNGGQLLEGVEQVMQDSCNHASFLKTLGPAESDCVVSLVYQCDRKDFMMDGCNAVLGWNARSVGAMKKGAAMEISFRGSLRAHFCPESNRLRSTDMIFDTGVIVAQRDALLG